MASADIEKVSSPSRSDVEKKGILPYSQSSVSHAVDVLADFPLVGSGVPYADCGQIFAIGCLNVEEHRGLNLDGVDMTGKAVIRYVRKSCHRALCPRCWGDWANREGINAKKRLDSFVLKNRAGNRMKPIHVAVSVSVADYSLDLKALRKKAYRVLKRVRCVGGMMVFHSKRFDKARGWYFSPHFHVIGYGWIQDVHRNYVASGWIVRNLGVRKNVKATIYYQLSHASVSEKFHVITWFGLLAYNKLHVKRVVPKPLVCPLCGKRLRKLVWIGDAENFLGLLHEDVSSGFYFEDASGWSYAKDRSVSYEYEAEGMDVGAYWRGEDV